jgi:hypothetical protein
MTLEQKGEFKSVLHIDANDFAVPTVVDVPINFDQTANNSVIVVDDKGIITPSIVVQTHSTRVLKFKAQDSFEMGMAQNIVDGNLNTFAEYPFVEGKNMQGEYIVSTITKCKDRERMQAKLATFDEQNVVDIDVISQEPFNSDSFTIFFDEHIANPTTIRVASIDSHNDEKILIPERAFVGRTVVFPEEYTDHYRITLRYNQPLRVNEIVFKEKTPPQVTQDFVRFIAQPNTAYDVYYNAYENVTSFEGEQPNLKNQSDVKILNILNVEENPLYKKADKDNDGVVDKIDNCVSVSNVDQEDLDKNGIGDACEDFDKDGIINNNDNCPNTANRYQEDADVDGIGDVCDDEESRFIEKNPWIPYVVLGIVCIVVVALIAKTLVSKD